MNPIEAKTDDQICELSHDNIVTRCGMSMLLTDNEVCLYPAESGGFHMAIPRDDWDEMVAWYTAGKVPEGDNREIDNGN